MKMYLGKQAVLSRKDKLKVFFRWFFYSLMLVLLYTIMSSGIFDKWQPIFIIPLAIAVAMHETEVAGSVFGLFCGFMIDTACGYLFGISSLWLMPICLGVALLVMNLIRIRVINHVWLTLSACVIMAFMDYLFNNLIWSLPNNDIILNEYILPSYLSAVILSPLLFFYVGYISSRFAVKDSNEPEGQMSYKKKGKGGKNI